MIRFDSENKQLEIQGSISDLVPESIFVIHEIYNMILEDDADNAHDAAEFYKKEVIRALPYVFVSKEEIKKANEESGKKAIEQLDRLKNALDSLQKLLDLCDGEMPEEDIRSADFDSNEEFNKWFHGEED